MIPSQMSFPLASLLLSSPFSGGCGSSPASVGRLRSSSSWRYPSGLRGSTPATHDSHDFSGLPSPAGAGAVAMMVLLSPTPVQHQYFIPVVGGCRLQPRVADGVQPPLPFVQGPQPEASVAGADPLRHRPGIFIGDSGSTTPVGARRDLHPLRTVFRTHSSNPPPKTHPIRHTAAREGRWHPRF